MTPPRRAGSVRRTTSHDCLRPEGVDGPVTVTARGRDLHTGGDGSSTTRATVRLDLEADFATATVAAIASDPPHAGIDTLRGRTARSGFRAAARAAVPDDTATGSVQRQLLDDLPIALLLSGRVPRALGIGLGPPGRLLPIDICAGWVDGGSLVSGYTDFGPPMHIGPSASGVERADDPHAWHDREPLPPHSTQRLRRIDAWVEDGTGHVESYFRDTHVDGAGVETLVHEYAVGAAIDLGTGSFTSCAAAPGALPYAECPGAAASAGRIVGHAVDGLRPWVGESLVGPSTCTHLNDALRALEDVGVLLAAVGPEAVEA